MRPDRGLGCEVLIERADWRSTPFVTRTGAILSLVSSAMIRGFLALGKNGEHSLYRIWHYKYHTYRVILYAIRQNMGVFYHYQEGDMLNLIEVHRYTTFCCIFMALQNEGKTFAPFRYLWPEIYNRCKIR